MRLSLLGGAIGMRETEVKLKSCLELPISLSQPMRARDRGRGEVRLNAIARWQLSAGWRGAWSDGERRELSGAFVGSPLAWVGFAMGRAAGATEA